MKNKILFTILFFLLFIIILSLSSFVLGYTVEYDGKTYDFGDIDNNLYDYIVVVVSFYPTLNNKVSDISLYTFNDCNGYVAEDGEYTWFYKDTKDVTRFFYNNVSNPYVTTSKNIGNFVISKSYSDASLLKYEVLFSNFDLKYADGTLYHNSDSIKKPVFTNLSEIESGKFSKICINTMDYLEVYFLVYKYYFGDSFNTISLCQSVLLNSGNFDYFVGTDFLYNNLYEIPSSHLDVDLVEGNRYGFKLAILNEDGVFEDLSEVDFDIGVVTKEEKEQADRDKQLALQEEQNKTNKGIWDSIKEVISYLNPFSENFFVYKLVELLVDAIKGLFIPSDDFIENFVNETNEWLSDRLGALYYPADIVVDFLTRIGNLNESGSAVISWNNFDFMGATLIPAYSYDLNSLLTNDTFENLHSIYLVVVDVILWLGLIILSKNTFVDIFGGKYLDDVVESGYTAYNKYSNKGSTAKKDEFRK